MGDTTNTRTQVARSTALVLALLVGVAGLALAKSKHSDPTTLLDGSWQMDLEHSESLKERLRAAGPPIGLTPGMPGMGMVFGGPMSVPTQPPPDEKERHDFASHVARDPALSALAQPPLELQIEDANGLIVLRSRGETIKTLRLPQAKSTIVLQNPVLDAEWRKDKLEARGRGPRRGKLIETYELVENGQTLVITTKVENAEGLPNLDVERVYRRVTTDTP